MVRERKRWAAITMLLLPAAVFGAQVEHHGTRVDPDALVAICLSCHDGSVAEAVNYCTVACNYRTSHSILREYPPKNKADKFVPVAELAAKGIRLEQGKVTCISCHDLRNPAPRHLITGQGRNLCRLCHIGI